MSRTVFWKQDPSVKEVGIRQYLVIPAASDGPRDKDLVIKGISSVIGDSNRDFLTPIPGTAAFDAVHTYTVVRHVLDHYRRDITRINNPGTSGRPQPPKPIEIKWQWETKAGTVPIEVYPHASYENNAYYAREQRRLAFGYFTDPRTGKREYTCRSFDIVAHETGHAILDALRPDLWDATTPEAGGIHEAFGDITAIFAMLSQLDMCEAIIVASKANLHNKTFFNIVAEQFGDALERTTGFGLRNADNDLKLSDVGDEVHDISQVLTGAIYDIIADVFDQEFKVDRYNPAETLLRVGGRIRLLFLAGIVFMESLDYASIGKKMIAFEPSDSVKAIIKNQFSRRDIGVGIKLKAIHKSTLEAMKRGSKRSRRRSKL